MRIKEIKKGSADIERGRVMMSIEGTEHDVISMENLLDNDGWKNQNTKCMDEIENDVYAVYYVMNRNEVAGFKKSFKICKKNHYQIGG